MPHQLQLDDSLLRFCHQYLQLEQELDFPNPQILRESHSQEFIYKSLFSEDGPTYKPPIRYQLRWLKELVRRIEASIDDWDEHEVHEPFMEILSMLLTSPLPSELTAAQQRAYVTYHLADLAPGTPKKAADIPHITLLESRSLLAASGTTGLRTWEAALHLSRYLCRHARARVAGRRVLELGAGTGFLSILCAQHLGAAHVLASDGSDDVVNYLPDNFFLNGLQAGTEGAHARIAATDLKWGHALVGTEESAWNGGRPVDLVIGADITYDKSVIPALVATLDDIVTLYPDAEVLISATERNVETYNAFRKSASRAGFEVDPVDFPVSKREHQVAPFYSDAVPIHICWLRRKRK